MRPLVGEPRFYMPRGNTTRERPYPKRPSEAKKKKNGVGREIGYFELNVKGLILQSPRTVILRLALEYNHPKN